MMNQIHVIVVANGAPISKEIERELRKYYDRMPSLMYHPDYPEGRVLVIHMAKLS